MRRSAGAPDVTIDMDAPCPQCGQKGAVNGGPCIKCRTKAVVSAAKQEELMEQAEVRTMDLPVKLSERELSLRAQELASAEGTLDDAERRLDHFVEAAKGTKKEIETEIADARGSVHRLAQIVRDRKEDRAVPVMEEPDYETGAVNTYRTDTHEIVATRGMTPEERQRSLFEQKAKKKPS